MSKKLITPSNIIIDGDVKDKEAGLYMIAEKAEELGISADAEETFKGFIEREQEMSTGFTDGFAIPHTRSDSIQYPSVIVVRLKHELNWETMDGQQVKIVIALLVPKEVEGNMHITLLSQLSRKLMKASFREEVMNSFDTESLFGCFKEIFE
ncbi:MAG: fructose PTS transporter subunit IIA [Staphylococcus equorum]|uniref:PTS EIIA type-2 domain-containing protein n=1 Tax=Tetragenococcus halophilus subsp. halophilus TaxID=1513897 RepID=A0A2H6CQV5_TETHA|nr:fructose PTS transporter subunit IIA [Tetragenococcus halophilus]MDN6159595.1 fructose PTS transporter subunit IIA [Staphylococcus equorum]MDN6161612.1 fructose PTS transporter subunit IIA [Atopostipes sp.]MDN6266716.1 fructose PTS transporter subunit IIA [Tetragenococcus koreensis]MDN6730561.1 fructose PTS transporter subunit IIA [Atopostipes suicloacalis]MDN6670772.1 fructose PTS transporter subunit IIA [Staphylococcus equorum]